MKCANGECSLVETMQVMQEQKNKIIKYHTLYMDIAERISQMSYAKRLQVGCVIVKDDRIISMGWNGTLPNDVNSCEDENGNTKNTVVHAEENAVCYGAKSGTSISNSILYCTHLPCMTCARLVINSGIKEVYYKHEYRDTSSIDLFVSKNVKIEKL